MTEAIEVHAETVPEQTQAVAVRETGGAVAPAEQSRPPITAAQAKVEAVANLTMKAYEAASTLKLTPEEIKALQADFPDEAFKPGAGGKEHLIYIEHAFLRDRLNQVIGVGQWAIVPRNRWAEPFTTGKGTEGNRVYVEAMLLIRGCFVSEAVGAMEYYPKNESQNYGDAVEGAKTAAFRRCAKELGVGLQAWKKDWCEGWWTRRRGGRTFGPQKSPGRSERVSEGTRIPKNPAPSRQTPNSGGLASPRTPEKPSEGGKAPCPTEKTREWMFLELEKTMDPGFVQSFFVAAGVLLPSETSKDLPLRWVAASRSELSRLQEAITVWGEGQDARMPYGAHEEPAPGKAAKPIEVPRDKPEPPKTIANPDKRDPEWWRDVIVPIPHKGQKRNEYLKSPDTIGSLYDQVHEQTADGQDARQRLWGFLNHFEPKGWTKKDGTQMPPNDADLKFREALNAFGQWHEKTHPDEKL